MEDLVVTLYLPGDGATTRFAGAPRPAGFAVASAPKASSEAPASATKRPTKTRRLKNADCEVDFFFMNGYELNGVEYETPLLAEMPETRQHFFLFSLFFILPVVNSPAPLPAKGGRRRIF